MFRFCLLTSAAAVLAGIVATYAYVMYGPDVAEAFS